MESENEKQGEDAFRGSGKYVSDKDKEITPEQKKKKAEVQQQITDIHKDSKRIHSHCDFISPNEYDKNPRPKIN